MTGTRLGAPAESYGFDPRDPAFVTHPYPVYRSLRGLGRPTWSTSLGLWLVADHASCSRLLRSPALQRVFEERQPAGEWAAFNWLNAQAILDMEGPRHDAIRRWLSPAFTRAGLDRIRVEVAAACEAVVDRALQRDAQGQGLDLVRDVFEQLPAVVICQVLGIDEDLGPRFREWSIAFVRMFDYATSDADQALGVAAARELAATMGELLKAGSARSGSLLQALARLADDGALNEQEAIANAVLLFNGGTGAVVNALGNGFVELLMRPEEMEKARRAIAVDAVAEEFLRFDSPLQAFERVVACEITVGEVSLAPGDRVCLLLGSANRDDSVFADPERFDADRPLGPTLTFGAGPHFCLGAPLARLEMTSLLATMLRAMPAIELAEAPVPDMSFVVRGYSSIPVNVG